MTAKKKALTQQQSATEHIRWIRSLAEKGGPYLTRDMEKVVRVALRGAHLDGREFELAKFSKDQDKQILKIMKRDLAAAKAARR